MKHKEYITKKEELKESRGKKLKFRWKIVNLVTYLHFYFLIILFK